MAPLPRFSRTSIRVWLASLLALTLACVDPTLDEAAPNDERAEPDDEERPRPGDHEVDSDGGAAPSNGGSKPDADDPEPPATAEDFISDYPGFSTGVVFGGSSSGGSSSGGSSSGGSSSGGTTGDTAGGTTGETPPVDGGDPERAISEADIIQVEGDRLYALSRFAGLSIIDVSDPTALRMLGNHRMNASPFEMYLDEGTAYVMFNDFGSYVKDDVSDELRWQTTGRLQALDVQDPSHIVVLGDQPIAGTISDSRRIGDIVYVVTYEDGKCWRCTQAPNTRVASFDVSSPSRLVAVDETRFVDANGDWGPRSVTVTDRRMYVAGPDWADRDSTIQVVDIADPKGALRLGVEVRIAGSVQSRWQMDEYEGVLRVVSQPRQWVSNDPPHLQTFQVVSADEVRPLASLEVALPRPEQLQSVRFDGDRAYAVTFERTDPLFTFDVSAPAAPKQLGQLEIPGFLYHMEPRGDRLYALGYDSQTGAGALHVSIFDISKLAAPVMLDRVNFGGAWASAAEDQDRIHKAFNLLLDQGLILVPFSGAIFAQATCLSDYRSGIQLIEVVGDDLTLRGMAPQIGPARRALLHREHLFGISDNAVQVFDIADHDAPKLRSSLEVARNVSHVQVVGDRLVRFGADWWTGRAALDITSLNDASTAEPIAKLDLSVGAQESCGRTSYWKNNIFVHGDVAYVVRHERPAQFEPEYHERFIFYIVDLRLPEELKVVGTFQVENLNTNDRLRDILLTDHALLVGRGERSYQYDPRSGSSSDATHAYDIFDLTDPRQPRFTQRFELPAALPSGGWGHGADSMLEMPWGWWAPRYDSFGALVRGDLVISQHEEGLGGQPGRVRFYLDRLDVSDPSAPRLLPPINIPGQVVHYDGESDRILTIDYLHRADASVDFFSCFMYGQHWFDDRTSACHYYEARLNSLSLKGDRATRVEAVELATNGRLANMVSITDTRAFYATRDRSAPYNVKIETLVHEKDGRIEQLAGVESGPAGSWWARLYAREERAFVATARGLDVIDTRERDHPRRTAYDSLGWDCASLEVHAGGAYCALGEYGVATFSLE